MHFCHDCSILPLLSDQLITIREVSLEEAYFVHEQIPEFQQHFPYTIETFHQRTAGKYAVSYIAYVNAEPAGYSISYERDADGSYYCWMAGVRPEFRRCGVLKALMLQNERYALENGYKALKVKTRNHRREMLSYLVSHGFEVVEVEVMDNVTDNRILFQKTLIV